jgi:signal transduction histidine kinase/ligand-binding sensor domain-containing protein/DNA-binding response OmpR family regulator
MLLLLACGHAWAHSGAVAVALPLPAIVIDGNVDDWPVDAVRYPVSRPEYGVTPRDADDLAAYYTVGYEPATARLLVALVVDDDAHVVDGGAWRSWDTEDGCELYLDTRHSDSSMAVQHSVRGIRGRGQLGRQRADEAVVAWSVVGRRTCYEWAVPMPAISVDSLRVPRTLAWDVVACDRDRDGTFSWVAWGPGAQKAARPMARGDLLLVPAEPPLGRLTGQARHGPSGRPLADAGVIVRSRAYPDLWARVVADGEGRFGTDVPAGDYAVRLELGGAAAAPALVQVPRATSTEVTLSGAPGKGRVVAAGPGRVIRADGARQEGWQMIAAQDGLPSGAVAAICQDRAGFLWAGTGTGLSRYDGVELTVFGPDDGLSGLPVTALAADSVGGIWVGSSSGLCRYRGGQFTRFGREEGLPDVEVRTLLVDPQGGVWVGTNGGLCRYDSTGFLTFGPAEGLSHHAVTSLAQDAAGRLWVAGAGLSVRRDDGLFAAAGPFAANQTDVRSLAVNAAGDVFVGTGDGLFRGRAGTWERLAPDGARLARSITELCPDRDGGMWVSSSDASVSPRYRTWRYAADRWELAGGPVGDHEALSLFEDREGNVWVGTVNELARHDAGDFASFAPTTMLTGPVIRALLEDRHGRVWVATDSGLTCIDHGQLWRYPHPAGYPKGPIRAMCEDAAGRLWVNAYGGGPAWCHLPEPGSSAPPSFTRPGTDVSPHDDRLGSMVSDTQGRLWFTSNGGGVLCYDRGRWQTRTTSDGLPSNSVGAIALAAHGQVWVATWATGVSLLGDRVTTRIGTDQGLPGSYAQALHTDAHGRLWIGLAPGGLCSFDSTGLACYTTRSGLVDDSVIDLASDPRGVLWVATYSGLNLFDGTVMQALRRRDGFRGVERVLADHTGHVWMATEQGLVRYRPRRAPPPVAITDVHTDRSHGPVARLRFDTSQPQVTIDFRGISFRTSPGGLVYRYRLQGYDTDWRTTRDEYALYPSLPRGAFRFEVLAVDRDLSYSPAPATVDLVVGWPLARAGLWVGLASIGLLALVLLVQIVRQHREALRARAAAEAANRAKSEFLANMSHEIRTPMNAVVGMVELLLDSETDDTRRTYLPTIDTASEALLSLLNSILDLSKIEAGRMSLEEVPFRLWTVLDGVGQTMAHRASQKGLELSCDIAPTVPEHVVGDPTRLRQLLMNLVGNAIKFTERGEVAVVLDLEQPVAQGNVRLLGRVRDTGIGVPADKQETIFEAFSQADSSTTRRYGGTGLGLTICAQLTALMHGRIWIESSGPEGTSFCFTARLREAASEAMASAPAGPEVSLAGLRLLVVDDNETNRLILCETARHWQASVVACSDGDSALVAYAQAATAGQPIEAVLLDLMMPGMDGVSVAQALLQMTHIPRPVLLLLSSADDAELARRARRAGIDQVLRKPAARPELGAALATQLARRRGQPGPPTAAPVQTPPAPVASAAETTAPRRILLAEDNQVNQLVTVRFLASAGHEVRVVADGQEALDALADPGFDLVLMDVQMPVRNGLEATRALRAREAGTGRHLPVIGLSASAGQEDRLAALASGMDDYLVKPVRRAELLAAVARAGTAR